MKNKKNTKEKTPMMDYINMMQSIENNNRTASRPALRCMTDRAEGKSIVVQKKQLYTDEEREKLAKRFKRLMAVLKALSVRYSTYAFGLELLSKNILGLSPNLRSLLNSFQRMKARMIDLDMASNNMFKACEPFNGISEQELDVQNDECMKMFFETAFNIKDDGSELDDRHVLVRMPIDMYNSMAVANPMFANLEVIGGKWDIVD